MSFLRRYGSLMIAVVIIIGAIVWLESFSAAPSFDGSRAVDGDLAPDVQGIEAWINSEPITSMEELRGKVVLVDFWTYSCINCIRTLPYLTAWDEKYRDDGLVIIGVHTPEFAFEKELANVQAAVDKYNIEYPVALDNDYQTWRSYQNRYWPRKYLVDKDGILRYDNIGEGAYEETERWIQTLLAEKGSDVDDSVIDLGDRLRTSNTPELYAGYAFALSRDQNLGNDGGFVQDLITEHVLPENIPANSITLEGQWLSTREFLEAKSDASVLLNFTASDVHMVAQSAQAQIISVSVDGEESHSVAIDNPDLYTLVDGEYGNYLLAFDVQEGFRLNSFTFG